MLAIRHTGRQRWSPSNDARVCLLVLNGLFNPSILSQRHPVAWSGLPTVPFSDNTAADLLELVFRHDGQFDREQTNRCHLAASHHLHRASEVCLFETGTELDDGTDYLQYIQARQLCYGSSPLGCAQTSVM